MKRRFSNTRRSATDDEMEEIYQSLALECREKFKIGVNPSDFLSTLLPWNEDTPSEYQAFEPPSEKKNRLQEMALANTGNDMHTLYVSNSSHLRDDTLIRTSAPHFKITHLVQ
jgi:hypothetical protein